MNVLHLPPMIPHIPPQLATHEDAKQQSSKNSLEARVDAIEQNANSNILLCSGQIIDDVIQSPPETLKDVVIVKISHAIPDNVDGEEIVRVTPFGRRRKHVKIECSSSYIKNKIINRAHQVKG